MCTKVCKIIDSMLTPATAGSIPLSFLLNHALGAISECLPSDREVLVNSDAGHGHLNEIFTGLSTVQRVIPCMQPSREEKRAVWHMISKLWVSPVCMPWIASGHRCSFSTGLETAFRLRLSCLPPHRDQYRCQRSQLHH